VRLSTFRHHYNQERPHSSLGYLTPLAFKAAWFEAQAKQQDPHIGTCQFLGRMSLGMGVYLAHGSSFVRGDNYSTCLLW